MTVGCGGTAGRANGRFSVCLAGLDLAVSFLVCSGGVDPTAGGEEKDQEGLQAGPSPFPHKPSQLQSSPKQHLL